MVVGDGVTVGGDEEAGALTGHQMRLGARRNSSGTAPSGRRRKNRSIGVPPRCVGAGSRLVRGPLLDLHADGDDGRLHLLDDVGETDRTLLRLRGLGEGGTVQRGKASDFGTKPGAVKRTAAPRLATPASNISRRGE